MSQPLTNAADYTVSELAQAVRRTMEDAFDYVRVRGEISGFRGQHASGHAYFSLKDADATIDAVVWKTAWMRLAFKPQEGLEVIATGRLTTFPKSSKYQIVIEQIEPAGAGALMALLEDRRRKLAAEGLFDRARKKPLPYLPRVIGIVTSPTGAVIRDILHRLNDRFPTRVLVWPVRVQGETSAAEVAAAVNGFNGPAFGSTFPRPDLLIVARGGGSIEDLWGFNEEIVVRAVAASGIPVISAVGHETDTTLIDHAADSRAPTPTAAAEAAVPVRADLVGYIDDQGARMRHGTRRIAGGARDRLRAAAAGLPRPAMLVAEQRQRLDFAASHLLTGLRHMQQRKALALARVAPRVAPAALARQAAEGRRRLELAGARLTPGRQVQDGRKRLGELATRILPAFRRGIEIERRKLAAAYKLLVSVSYRAVLARGFALVTDAEGELVRSAAQVGPGQPLTITAADETQIGVTVGGAPARRRPRTYRTGGDDGGQQSLF